MVINKHIVSVQELENGNYLVEFAAHSEMEEPEEEGYKEEESEEMGMQEEEKMQDEEEEKMEDEEDEEKSVSLADLLAELKRFNQ